MPTPAPPLDAEPGATEDFVSLLPRHVHVAEDLAEAARRDLVERQLLCHLRRPADGAGEIPVVAAGDLAAEEAAQEFGVVLQTQVSEQVGGLGRGLG